MSNIHIGKMFCIATREKYQDVYQRTYSLNAKVDQLHKLENVFYNYGVHNNTPISENLLAHEIPNIISLSNSVLGQAIIPNGWNTQRIRFILEVESNVAGNIVVSYIQGFTEYYDKSITGKLDPNMRFFINSVTNVIKMIDTVRGTYMVRPQSVFNVITDLAGGYKFEEVTGPSDLKLIRPRDIHESTSTLELFGASNDLVINTTGTIANEPLVSSRVNNNPLSYFTKTINSIIDAKADAANSYNLQDVYRSASINTAEPNIFSTPFMFELYGMYGNDLNSFKPIFTLNMLNQLDPMVASKIKLFDNTSDLVSNSFNTMLDTNDTQVLYQPTIETISATTVAHTITSIMIETLISDLSLSFSNLTGENVVIVSNVRSFIDGIDLIPYTNKIIAKVKNVLLPQITKNGLLGVEVILTADILGDTTVSIAISDGYKLGYHTPFRFPTFADSLYVPTITNSVNKRLIVDDFSNIIDSTYNSSPIHYN